MLRFGRGVIFNKQADVHDRSWWTSSAKLGSSPHQKIQSSRRPGVWCLRHTLSTSAFRQRLKLHRMGSSSVTGKRMGDEVGPCHTKHFHLIPVRSAWRQRERENVLEKSIMWDSSATGDKANTPLGLVGIHMQKHSQSGNLSVWLCNFDKCRQVREVFLWLMHLKHYKSTHRPIWNSLTSLKVSEKFSYASLACPIFIVQYRLFNLHSWSLFFFLTKFLYKNHYPTRESIL